MSIRISSVIDEFVSAIYSVYLFCILFCQNEWERILYKYGTLVLYNINSHCTLKNDIARGFCMHSEKGYCTRRLRRVQCHFSECNKN